MKRNLKFLFVCFLFFVIFVCLLGCFLFKQQVIGIISYLGAYISKPNQCSNFYQVNNLFFCLGSQDGEYNLDIGSKQNLSYILYSLIYEDNEELVFPSGDLHQDGYLKIKSNKIFFYLVENEQPWSILKYEGVDSVAASMDVDFESNSNWIIVKIHINKQLYGDRRKINDIFNVYAIYSLYAFKNEWPLFNASDREMKKLLQNRDLPFKVVN